MLENLFKFPIVMVDGDKEQQKMKRREDLALDDDEDDIDIIYGEAECPYFDFLSVTDRWLPTDESLERAMNGEFDACFVIFSHSGSFVVPWNKDKFKQEFKRFIASMPKEKGVIDLSKKEFLDLIKAMPNDEEHPGYVRE